MGGPNYLPTILMAFILFLFSQISLSLALTPTCIIPENSSLADVKAFPEQYDLECKDIDLLSRLFGDSGCLGLLDSLCAHNFSPNVEDIKSNLRDDRERKVFEDVINYFEKAEEKLEEAKKGRNDLLILLLEKDVEICNTSSSGIKAVMNEFKLVPAIVICPLETHIYDWKASEVVTNTRAALENTGKGINLAFNIVSREADDLYCIGGGYTNYTTQASLTYAGVMDFIRISSLYVAEEREELPRKWSVLLKQAWDIQDKFSETGFSECLPAKFMNSTYSNETIFNQLLLFYREIKTAKEDLLNKYQSRASSVGDLAVKSEDEYKWMVAEDYNLVNIHDIALFSDENITFLETQPLPSTKVIEVQEILYGKGFSPGALETYREGLRLYDREEQFYVSRALEKFDYSEEKFVSVISLINSTKNYVSELIEKAKDKASQKRLLADQAIEDYSLSGKIEAELYNSAKEKMQKADDFLFGIELKTQGKQVRACAEAFTLYEEIIEMLKDKIEYRLDKLNQAKGMIADLENIISLAEKDDIDTFPEENVLEGSKALLEISDLKISDIERIIKNSTSAKDTIYEKASSKYAFLREKRLKIIEEVKLLSEITDVGELEKSVNTYESLVENGTFVTEKTIGKYKEIISTYTIVEEELEKRKPTAFAAYLSKKVDIKKIIPEIVSFDEEENVVTSININNDLSFGCDISFTIKIAGINIDIGSKIDSPENIDVAYDKEGAYLLFDKVDPIMEYSVIVDTTTKLIETKNRVKKRLIFDQDELRERIDVVFQSSEEIQTAAYSEDTKADICNSYYKGVEVTTLTDVENVTVYLDSVKRGKGSFYIICKKFNPLTSYTSNETIDDAGHVSYFFNVRSNIESVDDVPITLMVPGNVISGSVRVYDLSGKIASDFKFSKYGGSYAVSWRIPILTEEYQTFIVSYDAEDPEVYINRLRREVVDLAANTSTDVSSYVTRADTEISTKRYSDAIKILNEAKKEIEKNKNIKIQKSAIEERVDQLVTKLNISADDISNLTKAGFSDAAVELNKKIINFEAKKREISDFLKRNKTSDAIRFLKDLEKLAGTKKVDNIFYKKEKELFNRLGEVKKDMLLLSKTRNLSEILEEISDVEVQIPSIGEIISKGNYVEVGEKINNISEKIVAFEDIRENATKELKDWLDIHLTRVKLLNSIWKDLKVEISKMITISDENPGRRISTDKIEESFNEIEKEIGDVNSYYDTLKKIKESEISENINTINMMDKKAEEVNQSIVEIGKIKNSYKANAEMAYEISKRILEDAAKSAVSKEEKEEVNELLIHLNNARKAYSAGKYLDSIIYADYIKRKAEKPKEEEIPLDPIIFGVVVVVVVATAVAILITKREKQEKMRELKKIK